MILKVQSAEKADGWFVYDNAEDVFYSRHLNTKEFFRDSMGGGTAALNVIAVDDATGFSQGSFFSMSPQPIRHEHEQDGWFVSFIANDRKYEFWGDTTVYMLNDNGKTIERIF